VSVSHRTLLLWVASIAQLTSPGRAGITEKKMPFIWRWGYTCASKLEIGITGILRTCPKVFAADTVRRRPVYWPGPLTTPTNAMSFSEILARSHSELICSSMNSAPFFCGARVRSARTASDFISPNEIGPVAALMPNVIVIRLTVLSDSTA